jgi:exonuclease SbcC
LGDNQTASASLALKVEGRKNVVENLKQRQNSLDAQITAYCSKLEEVGIAAAQSSESSRTRLAALEDQIGRLRAEQEATLRGMQTDQKRLASLSTENRCPLCMQPLNDEYKNGLLQRIQEENTERQGTMEQLQSQIGELQRVLLVASDAFSNLQVLNVKADHLRAQLTEEERNLTEISSEFEEKQTAEVELQRQLETVQLEIGRFDIAELEAAREQREQAFGQYHRHESDLRIKENRKKDLLTRMDEIKERIDLAQEKVARMEKIGKTVEIIGAIRDAYRSIQPKLRGEFVKVLRNFVQQVLDGLAGEVPMLNVVIDETYTPYVKSESGVEREVANLSGGERTLLAFAYRLGLGQLIMQSRTGHGLSMLLLDEPTESLGREDGSIDRLAEAISRFKAIEQIIAVTHSEAFAEKAEHVVTLEREAGISKVSIGR